MLWLRSNLAPPYGKKAMARPSQDQTASDVISDPVDLSENGEALLRGILSAVARQTFPVERLLEIVGAGDKQKKAFNLCDGSRSQGEIAKACKLDNGNFSRTVARWVEAGVVVRLGTGRESTPLHVYPLPDDSSSKKMRRKP